MKIELWLDFVCPYCYMGEKMLTKALEELELKDSAEISYRSFQLNVNAVSLPKIGINEHTVKKYGVTYEQAKATNDGLIQMALDVGLHFKLDELQRGNTRLAHETFKYAESIGLGQEMVDRLFAAYFEEGKNISTKQNLIKLATEINIPENDISEALEKKIYRKSLLEDQQQGIDMEIDSIPYIIFDDEIVISGEQSIEKLKKVIRKITKQ